MPSLCSGPGARASRSASSLPTKLAASDARARPERTRTAGTRDRLGSARPQLNCGTKTYAGLTRVPCLAAKRGQEVSPGRWAFACGRAGRCHDPKAGTNETDVAASRRTRISCRFCLVFRTPTAAQPPTRAGSRLKG